MKELTKELPRGSWGGGWAGWRSGGGGGGMRMGMRMGGWLVGALAMAMFSGEVLGGARVSESYRIPTDAVDSGVTRVSGGGVTIVSSLGEISGISTAVGPARRVESGLIGALYEPTAVTIVSQPGSQTVNQGAGVSMSVVASGTGPLGYQWKKGGVDVAGGVGSTLSFPNVQPGDGGNYTVVVSNVVGSVTSGVAVLVVVPTTYTLFQAAETGLLLADAGMVSMNPVAGVSVVTGGATYGGGASALKVGAVDSGTTTVVRTVVGPAVVKFRMRVSSEAGFDFFRYLLDGAVEEELSGAGGWVYREEWLGAGTHTLSWVYAKDESDFGGEDGGFLDDLEVLDAYGDLEVKVGGAVVTGSATLEFGSVAQGASEVVRTVVLKNLGTIPLAVGTTVTGGAFSFAPIPPASLELGPLEEVTLSVRMGTGSGGVKTGLLGLSAPESRTLVPTITLSGVVVAATPIVGVSWSGGALANGQGTAVGFGTTPADLVFTVTNTGTMAMTIGSVSVVPAGDFAVVSGPAGTVAMGGSTTFTVRAISSTAGTHSGTVTLVTNAEVNGSFSFPVSSKSYLVVGGSGYVPGSFVNTGTVSGWDVGTTGTSGGGSGLVMKSGATPDGGNSTMGATFAGPGLLRWSWKVSSQQGYDWLVCEVDGVEVAGISTKVGVWQTQVAQVGAGSVVRWIYRKDAVNVSGEDAGYVGEVSFGAFGVSGESYAAWSTQHGEVSPTAVMMKGGLLAVYGWLGGIDPAVGPLAGEYRAVTSGGMNRYRYRIAKIADGLARPQFSGDLVGWSGRKMSQSVVSEDAAGVLVECAVAGGVGSGWFRLVAGVPVWPAGFVAVTGLGSGGFWMGKYEVQWGEFQTVRSYGASHGYDIGGAGTGNGNSYPVTNVSWYEALKWCNARSEMDGLTPVYTVGGAVYRSGESVPTVNGGNGYRLPSEAEWEYAASGGALTHGYLYSGSNDANAVAWTSENAGGGIHVVGTKLGNELGIFDMSGNVWELCFDVYTGTRRVIRGRSWYNSADYARASGRESRSPSDVGGTDFGFRVVRSFGP